MFNIKNDNKTYRIPCLSTRSTNPQHVIGVGGPLGSFATPLTERQSHTKRDRGGGGATGRTVAVVVAEAVAVAVAVAVAMVVAVAWRWQWRSL